MNTSFFASEKFASSESNDEIYELMAAAETSFHTLNLPVDSASTVAASNCNELKCRQCSDTFRSKSQLKNHNKLEHVETVVLKSLQGHYLTTFVRNPMTKLFNCNCGKSFKSSCKAYIHRKCYLPEASNRDSESRSVDESILKRLGLLVFSSLLICEKCNSAISKSSVRSHMKYNHGEVLSRDELSFLEDLASSTKTSIYWPYHGGLRVPLPPIPFLPVLKGYRCLTCSFAAKSRPALYNFHRTVDSTCSNSNCEFVYSSYQRLRFGSIIFGYAVHETEITASLQVAEIAIQNMRDAARSGQLDGAESQLYVRLGWFVLNEEGTDFVDIPKRLMSDIKGVEISEDLRLNLIAFFRRSIKNVGKKSLDFRCLLSDGTDRTIRIIDDKNDAYATVFADLIIFVIKIIQLSLVSLFGSEAKFVSARIFVDGILNRNRVGNLLFKHLKGIWKLLVTEKLEKDKEDLIKYFIKFRCFNVETGSLSKASRVEMISAKCFYFCRLFWLENLNSSSRSKLQVAKKVTEKYFNSRDSTFKRLCILKGLSRKISEGEEIRMTIVTDPTSPEKIWVSGKLIDRSSLGRCYKGLCRRFKYLLESLFVGVPFDFGIHTYSDDLQGYAIKCESIPSSAFLLSRVMKDSRFFVGPNSDGSLDIRTAIAKKYMLEYEEAVEILCALTHLCSGMPARATELCSLRFNTRMSERNLFWLGEQIMTVTRKNKRNNLTGITNCINRFFPKELSKLVSAFIIFVNPVYSFFATNVYGLSVSGSVTSNLFVRKGRPYTPEFCRSVFVDMLFKYGQLTCSFGNYRHVVNHFVKNVILFKFHHVSDDSTFGEKDGEDLIEDLQLGHSRRTANMAYSINSEERIGRQYIVNEYRSLSSKWVEFLNSSTAPFSIRSSESIVSDEKETCCSSIPVADPESNNFNDEIDRKDEVDEKLRYIKTCEFLPNVSEILKVTSLLQRFKEKLGFDKFKSQVQRMAAIACITSDSDVISVIPTGGGKSLLFLLHLFSLEDCDKVTIVVVPTKSLRTQILKLASGYGFAGSDSLAGFRLGHFKIIVCTPETMSNQESQLANLIGSKIVSRIFLDEAHMIIHDEHWRVNFDWLSKLRLFKVPLAFLTGTLSIQDEKELISRFRRDEYSLKVFRESTNRRNLVYRVVKNADMLSLDRLLNDLSLNSKAIIFVKSIKDLCSVISDSNLSQFMTTYSSDNSDEENQFSSQLWSTGERFIMVATSGFGVGIDVADVHLIVCFGRPYGFEAMIQQFGRGGRDGKICQVYLLDRGEFDNDFSDDLVRSYSLNTKTCRRLVITSYLDSMGIDCAGSDSSLCDVCEEGFNVIQIGKVPLKFLTDPLRNRSTPTKAISGPIYTKKGEQIVKDEEIYYMKLINALDFANSYCMRCMLVNNEFHDKDENCKIVRKHCFDCYSTDHWSKNTACPEIRIQKTSGYHFKCGLPENDLKFHKNINSPNIECRYLMVMKWFRFQIRTSKSWVIGEKTIITGHSEVKEKILNQFITYFAYKQAEFNSRPKYISSALTRAFKK